MGKSLKIGIIAGTIILFVFCGWYILKKRECVNNIQYIPAREGYQPSQSEFNMGRRRSIDKGDYYEFEANKFKTFKDAVRACMWK